MQADGEAVSDQKSTGSFHFNVKMNTQISAKEHYDQHLGGFYSWMTGDLVTKTSEFKKFLTDNSITPDTTKIAIDLGAGHGIQSIPLAEQGFKVIAVDFNEALLSELRSMQNT